MTEAEFQSAFETHKDAVYHCLADVRRGSGRGHRAGGLPRAALAAGVVRPPRQELGFRRGGEIRGSVARFTLGEETITLLSGDQIAPGAGAYALYVLRDPRWKPTYANANTDAFIIGAADRAEYVVGTFGR